MSKSHRESLNPDADNDHQPIDDRPIRRGAMEVMGDAARKGLETTQRVAEFGERKIIAGFTRGQIELGAIDKVISEGVTKTKERLGGWLKQKFGSEKEMVVEHDALFDHAYKAAQLLYPLSEQLTKNKKIVRAYKRAWATEAERMIRAAAEGTPATQVGWSEFNRKALEVIDDRLLQEQAAQENYQEQVKPIINAEAENTDKWEAAYEQIMTDEIARVAGQNSFTIRGRILWIWDDVKHRVTKEIHRLQEMIRAKTGTEKTKLPEINSQITELRQQLERDQAQPSTVAGVWFTIKKEQVGDAIEPVRQYGTVVEVYKDTPWLEMLFDSEASKKAKDKKSVYQLEGRQVNFDELTETIKAKRIEYFNEQVILDLVRNRETAYQQVYASVERRMTNQLRWMKSVDLSIKTTETDPTFRTRVKATADALANRLRQAYAQQYPPARRDMAA